MWNGSSAYNGNSAYSNSFKPNGDGRDLPYVFRMAMPQPATLVSGI